MVKSRGQRSEQARERRALKLRAWRLGFALVPRPAAKAAEGGCARTRGRSPAVTSRPVELKRNVRRPRSPTRPTQDAEGRDPATHSGGARSATTTTPRSTTTTTSPEPTAAGATPKRIRSPPRRVAPRCPSESPAVARHQGSRAASEIQRDRDRLVWVQLPLRELAGCTVRRSRSRMATVGRGRDGTHRREQHRNPNQLDGRAGQDLQQTDVARTRTTSRLRKRSRYSRTATWRTGWMPGGDSQNGTIQ